MRIGIITAATCSIMAVILCSRTCAFLYDQEKDPQEACNLVETCPEIAIILAEMMDEWEKEMRANLRGGKKIKVLTGDDVFPCAAA